MEVRVEYSSGDVEVVVRGPKDSPELLRILDLLNADNQRLWDLDEEKRAVPISPKSIVWAEVVDNKAFVYTENSFYEVSVGLGELENRWESLGIFRCAKSSVINLNAVHALRSCPGGRIEAIMVTGEKVMVFRRYAPLLRGRIQEGV